MNYPLIKLAFSKHPFPISISVYLYVIIKKFGLLLIIECYKHNTIKT